MQGESPISSVPPLAMGTAPPMELRYSLSRLDVFRSRLRAVLQNRVLQVLYLGILLWNVWRATSWAPTLFAKIVGGIFVLASLLVVLAGSLVVVVAAMTFLAKNRGVVGSHTLKLTDTGLVEITDFNENHHRWAGMHAVRFAGAFLYVYVTETIYHPIPLHAFASREQASAFADEVRRRIAMASGRS
jgi:hypothetical protein